MKTRKQRHAEISAQLKFYSQINMAKQNARKPEATGTFDPVNSAANQIANESFSRVPDPLQEHEETFTTVSNPLQIYQFEKGSVLTGTFCGIGKTLGEGKNSMKTWLFFDRLNGEFTLVPRWQGLEKLSQVDPERYGKDVYRITYNGNKKNEDGTIEFHLIKLEKSNVEASGIYAKTLAEIRNVLISENETE